MKKLIIKIGNKTHELPYNGEAYSVEVSDKYIPKVGDCVRMECRGLDSTNFYLLKVKEISNARIDFSLTVRRDLYILKDKFFVITNSISFTQITTEELKAKYAEAGYDWDYDTDTIKPIKWMPKDGEEVWWLSLTHEPVNSIFDEEDEFIQLMLEKGLLFKTKEECQEFSNHCLSYLKK